MANPFLVLGGVAVGIITAGIGVLQVPGWIASAQDSAAKNDVAQVTIAEAAAITVKGAAFDTIGGLNSSGSGVSVTQSGGVKVGIDANDTDYVVVAESESGKVFVRINGGDIEVFEGGTAAENLAAAAADSAISDALTDLGLTLPTPVVAN